VRHIRPVLPVGAGHLLITTRRGGFGYVGPVLNLDVLPRPVAVTLLRRRAPALTDDHAGALAELLGDLPLALEQAAAYLDQTQLPPATYLHLLTARAADMCGRGRVVDHQDTIATLWSLSLDQLRARQPADAELLGLCAYLAPEPIPLELFTDHAEYAPLNRVASDPLAFADTVGSAIDYSLARRTDAGVLLHRLVQAFIRQPRPSQPGDLLLLPMVLGLLRADLPWDVVAAPENWPRWQQLLPHVLIATAHHDDAKPTAASATSWLLIRAAIYQHTHGRSAAARVLLERALHIGEIAYGADHSHVAAILNNLAWVLEDLGEPATARRLCVRSLHIYETAYGPDHPEVATALNTLAAALRMRGELVAGRSLLERALRIRETAYGADHPLVAITLNHLAQPWSTWASQARPNPCWSGHCASARPPTDETTPRSPHPEQSRRSAVRPR
jgi:tetratricopeptide (TPR) repeat protein